MGQPLGRGICRLRVGGLTQVFGEEGRPVMWGPSLQGMNDRMLSWGGHVALLRGRGSDVAGAAKAKNGPEDRG